MCYCRAIMKECNRHQIEVHEPTNSKELYAQIDTLCDGKVVRYILILPYKNILINVE